MVVFVFVVNQSTSIKETEVADGLHVQHYTVDARNKLDLNILPNSLLCLKGCTLKEKPVIDLFSVLSEKKNKKQIAFH